jgi:hypothetical protein
MTLGNDEQWLTPLDFSPFHQQQVMASPNGRAYATVVLVGSDAVGRSPLGDRELDAMESFATSVAPLAVPLRATPDVAWWNMPDNPHLDKLQLWLYPGPMIQVHWALDASDTADDAMLVLDPVGLVAFWRHVLGASAALGAALKISEYVVGLNVQTLPAGRPMIVDLDFPSVPKPTRSGITESAPPWSAMRVGVPIDGISDALVLRPALDQLLRHFSYRHTDTTIDAALSFPTAPWDVESPPTRVVGKCGTRQEPTSVG